MLIFALFIFVFHLNLFFFMFILFFIHNYADIIDINHLFFELSKKIYHNL